MRICVLLAVFIPLFAVPAAADVPLTINHQGFIRVQETPFTGNGVFRFGFYDADSRWLWTNDGSHTGDPIGNAPTEGVTIFVSNGIYAVPLGDTSQDNMQPIPGAVFDDDTVMLRVFFDDGVHGQQLLAPDQPVTASPYTYHAITADTVRNQDVIAELDELRGMVETLSEFLNLSSPNLEMLCVPEGSFVMGRRDDGDDGTDGEADELPRHTVTLSAYEIGKYSVTNRLYASVLNWAYAQGYLKNSAGGAWSAGNIYVDAGDLQMALELSNAYCQITHNGTAFTWKTRDGHSMAKHPVVMVTWYGAVAFCNWLSEWAGLAPCYNLATWERIMPLPNGYRLPTEAEWERAAAWDGTKHWIYGITSDTLVSAMANYDDANPLGLSSQPYTTPVGYYDGNTPGTIRAMSPVGCYDMCGNVWNWCHDWYLDTYYSGGDMTDPVGPETGTQRLLRGGSWSRTGIDCRSAIRGFSAPSNARLYNGFRVSRTP